LEVMLCLCEIILVELCRPDTITSTRRLRRAIQSVEEDLTIELHRLTTTQLKQLPQAAPAPAPSMPTEG
jgi:hypothetical protein